MLQGEIPDTVDAAGSFRQELRDLRDKLGTPLDRLDQLDRLLLDGAHGAGDRQHRDKVLVDLVCSAALFPDLESLLGAGSEEACLSRAREIVDDRQSVFRDIADRLRQLIAGVTISASEDCSKALPEPAATPHAQLARLCVRVYYDYYEDFDLVLFPLVYPDHVGEIAAVDVIRVSPIDAERSTKAPKLAGTTLMNFGAFLRRAWRVNDILWGRLDGAQRFITALLPEPADQSRRQALIDDAHRIILGEDLRPEDRTQLYQMFTDALVQAGPGNLTDADIAAVVREFRDSLAADVSGRVLRLLLEEDSLIEYMRKYYEVDRRRHAVTELRLLARVVHITSQVAEGLARKHLPANPRVAWLARAGLIFWGVVEVLVPDSLARLVTIHFFKLLYLFALLLLTGGLLFGATSVWQLGLSVLLVTAFVHGGVVWIGDAVAGRRPLGGAVRDLGICVVVAFALYGTFHLMEQFFTLPSLDWLRGIGSREVGLVATGLVAGGAIVAGLVRLVAAGWARVFGRKGHIQPCPITAAGQGRDRPG